MGDPGDEYRSPKRAGGVTVQLHVYVNDVDEHCERARGAGAEIVAEPHDHEYGDRRYDAKDPEGHLWSFAQHIRDVPAEEWGATAELRSTQTKIERGDRIGGFTCSAFRHLRRDLNSHARVADRKAPPLPLRRIRRLAMRGTAAAS